MNEKGDVIDAKASLVMFAKSRLDTDGEIPSPHREERFNFNPHDITGNFEKDRNGKPVLKRGSNGDLYDRDGNKCNPHGLRVNNRGDIINKYNRKTFDKSQLTASDDIPALLNYDGQAYNINDLAGRFDKDSKGDIVLLDDGDGNIIDKSGHRCNNKGYLTNA